MRNRVLLVSVSENVNEQYYHKLNQTQASSYEEAGFREGKSYT